MNKSKISLLALMLIILTVFNTISFSAVITGTITFIGIISGLSLLIMTMVAGLHIYEHKQANIV